MIMADPEVMACYRDEAKGRQREHGGTAPGRASLPAKLPEVSSHDREARAQAAKAADVSPRTMQSAITVRERGVPELVEAVQAGRGAANRWPPLARARNAVSAMKRRHSLLAGRLE